MACWNSRTSKAISLLSSVAEIFPGLANIRTILAPFPFLVFLSATAFRTCRISDWSLESTSDHVKLSSRSLIEMEKKKKKEEETLPWGKSAKTTVFTDTKVDQIGLMFSVKQAFTSTYCSSLQAGYLSLYAFISSSNSNEILEIRKLAAVQLFRPTLMTRAPGLSST